MTIAAPTPSLPCPATRAHIRAAHVAWLHPKGSVGRAWVGKKIFDDEGEQFEGETLDPAEASLRQHSFDDEYVSLNRFWGRSRITETMKAVGQLVLDFDYQAEGKGLPCEGWAPEAVRDMLIEAMVEAGVPLPSLWIASGRGLQAQYGCEGAKAAAWARVRAVYDALHGPDLASNGMPKARRRHADPELDAIEAKRLPMWRLFKACGLDRSCRDGARVVRLAGSINVKNGAMARLIAPAAFADATRYSFHALADAILPVARHELLKRRKARVEAKAAAAHDNPKPASPRRHAGPAGRWVGILRDLHAWRDGMGGPPKGRRELWLFLTANATAHVKGGCREDWVAELAPLAGLSEKEAFRALGTLDRRQRRHEAGETDEHEGVEQSALYNHGAALMVDLLDIQVEQAERFGLRSLYPGGGKSLTPAERQEARRRRLGIESGLDSSERRIWIGLYAIGQRTDGWSLSDICAHHDLSKDTVLSYMRAASADMGLDGAIDVVTLQAARVAAAEDLASRMAHAASKDRADATKDGSSSDQAVDIASRYIVVSASREARTASEPDAPAAGEVRIRRWTRVFATVTTATGRWDWMRVEDVWARGFNHFEVRLVTDPAVVSAADAALAETAFQELAAAAFRPVSMAPRMERRRSVRTRQAPFQMAPLDVAADQAREAELYREASGRSSYRDRHKASGALVAA